MNEKQQLTQDELNQLYEWVDKIPLSRRKKNLPRDFCDAVLMAEVCAHFYPKIVDLFNYDQAFKIETKIYNWNTLNTKVLTKLKYPLDKETISDIASAKPGVIERVLWGLKNHITNLKIEESKPIIKGIGQTPDEFEIEEAKLATDIELLLAKRKEYDDNNIKIKNLEDKISSIEALIKAKNIKIAELTGKYATKR